MIEQKYGLRIKQEGANLYQTFTPQERACVRFGMQPAGKTLACEEKLAREIAETEGRPLTPQDRVDLCRLLSVAVMDAANAGPDKMIV